MFALINYISYQITATLTIKLQPHHWLIKFTFAKRDDGGDLIFNFFDCAAAPIQFSVNSPIIEPHLARPKNSLLSMHFTKLKTNASIACPLAYDDHIIQNEG